MTLVLSEYVRKPFVVKAVKVTLDNMSDVAQWCGGKVRKSDTSADGGMSGEVFYIKVDVKRPLDDRQTRAYIGDYVLAAGQSFKCYTDYAFKKSFVPNTDSKPTPTTTGKKRRPRPTVGPDLSPISSGSRNLPKTDVPAAVNEDVASVQPSEVLHTPIHPNQMALLEVHDKGFPDEPEEMRETHTVVTVNPSLVTALNATALELSVYQARGLNTY